MIVLSICIPSYNRFLNIKAQLQSLLEIKSNEFDIIIVDNGSPHNIYEEIPCKDNRVKILKRKKVVSPAYSYNTCVSYADGKYALLLLDQDYINGKYLKAFIEILKSNETHGGYCVLSSENTDKEYEVWEKERALPYFGYLGQHPSGIFFRTEYIKKLFKMHETIEFENRLFYDILLTECAVQGRMIKCYLPLVRRAKKEERLAIQSYNIPTPTPDLFFFPRARLKQMDIYCRHLTGLRCSKDMYNKTVEYLYKRTLWQMTTLYRLMSLDRAECLHYRISPRKISIFESLYWWFIFNVYFWRKDINISCGVKLKIIGKVNLMHIKNKVLNRRA